jgi:cytochrome oxidase Cu insertion factor (SCO1/SenC/PrrC family)
MPARFDTAHPSWAATLAGRPRNWLLLMAVLGGVPLFSGLTRGPPPPVPLTPLRPAFSLLDEHAKPFTQAGLPGHVWVVAFVDPGCVGCGERVHDAVTVLEHRTRNLWPMFGLLTVALGPVLPAPAAVPQAGRLLTGADAGPLASSLALGDAQETQRLTQGRRLAVLDAHGRLRARYDNDSAGLDRLLHDVSLLANRGD